MSSAKDKTKPYFDHLMGTTLAYMMAGYPKMFGHIHDSAVAAGEDCIKSGKTTEYAHEYEITAIAVAIALIVDTHPDARAICERALEIQAAALEDAATDAGMKLFDTGYHAKGGAA